MYVYYGTNDWWDYLRARPTNDILAHSAKGKKWDDHKYIGITPGGSYIYPKSVMKGWSSYVEPVGPKAPKYAKTGYSGQGPARQAPKGRAPMPSMHAKAAQAKSLSDTTRKVNSFGYKANKFAQDTLNAGRGALNNAWNGLSGAVDTAGRAVSDAYDRARGNQAGSTWNRVTRGDNHLNTEDITDRIGSRVDDARKAIGGAWDRATGGDGFDLGDVRRWAGDAGRAVWNGASRAVDTVGRAASDAYDRARGGEAGSTWGRITRGDNHFDTEDLTDRVRGAYDRATGGDGLDLGDVRRWAGDAGRAVWNGTSRAVDTAGRAASNLYDRARGNEEGSTWNRITRGDDHLNTEDVTQRIGNAVTQAGRQSKQLFDAAGNRIQTTLNDWSGQEPYEQAQYFYNLYQKTGDPRHLDAANSFMDEYRATPGGWLNDPIGNAGRMLEPVGQNVSNAVRQVGENIGGAVGAVGTAAQNLGSQVSEGIQREVQANNEMSQYNNLMDRYRKTGDLQYMELAQVHLQNAQRIRNQ